MELPLVHGFLITLNRASSSRTEIYIYRFLGYFAAGTSHCRLAPYPRDEKFFPMNNTEAYTALSRASRERALILTIRRSPAYHEIKPICRGRGTSVHGKPPLIYRFLITFKSYDFSGSAGVNAPKWDYAIARSRTISGLIWIYRRPFAVFSNVSRSWLAGWNHTIIEKKRRDDLFWLFATTYNWQCLKLEDLRERQVNWS